MLLGWTCNGVSNAVKSYTVSWIYHYKSSISYFLLILILKSASYVSGNYQQCLQFSFFFRAHILFLALYFTEYLALVNAIHVEPCRNLQEARSQCFKADSLCGNNIITSSLHATISQQYKYLIDLMPSVYSWSPENIKKKYLFQLCMNKKDI